MLEVWSRPLTDTGLTESYTLDLATMNELLKQHIAMQETITASMDPGSEKESLQRELVKFIQKTVIYKDDESYLFLYRQAIDDIPVIATCWNAPGATQAAGNKMQGTLISAILTKQGLHDMQASSVYAPNEKGASQNLISALAALDLLIGQYQQVLLTDDIVAQSMHRLFGIRIVNRIFMFFERSKSFNLSLVNIF